MCLSLVDRNGYFTLPPQRDSDQWRLHPLPAVPNEIVASLLTMVRVALEDYMSFLMLRFEMMHDISIHSPSRTSPMTPHNLTRTVKCGETECWVNTTLYSNNSYNKYLLNVYYMPHTLLVPGNIKLKTKTKKIWQSLLLCSLYSIFWLIFTVIFTYVLRATASLNHVIPIYPTKYNTYDSESMSN